MKFFLAFVLGLLAYTSASPGLIKSTPKRTPAEYKASIENQMNTVMDTIGPLVGFNRGDEGFLRNAQMFRGKVESMRDAMQALKQYMNGNNRPEIAVEYTNSILTNLDNAIKRYENCQTNNDCKKLKDTISQLRSALGSYTSMHDSLNYNGLAQVTNKFKKAFPTFGQ